MGVAHQCLEQKKMDEGLAMSEQLNQLATRYLGMFLLDFHTKNII